MAAGLSKALTDAKSRKSGITVAKARELLRDGTANGKSLTPAQRRLFNWVAGASKW